MKKFTRYLFLLWLVSCFFSSLVFAQGSYPQLDISGYKKWEYKKAKVDPNRNYFAGLTQLGGFYPTFTGGPWQERLQLRILGQLSEDLSVTYDLEQQPELPERFDVKVKYFNHELTFGDFTANFSGNEFASTSKYLNGVMLTSKDSWYDIIAVPSAKLKSQTQNLTSQTGNNTRGPYSLGHGSIVEGSERIKLNDIPLTRNVDYTIDYFEGQITFNRILTSVDSFQYTYEFTNILDLFFPSLSKRDFFGFQSRFTFDPEEFGKPTPKKEPVALSAEETFPSVTTGETETIEKESSGRYQLKNTPVVNFSENLTFRGTKLRKNEDYIIRYEKGEIKLLTRFLPSKEDPLLVAYNYYKTTTESESIAGIGSRGPYSFAHPNIVPESERIQVDGKLFVRDLDYVIDYAKGEVVFGIVVGPTSQIKATYRYTVMVLPEMPPTKFPKELVIGTTYLKESAKKGAAAASATVIESFTGENIIKNSYHIYLHNLPVLSTAEGGAPVVVTINGVEAVQNVDFAIPITRFDPVSGSYVPSPEANLAFVNDPTDPSDGYTTGTVVFLNESLITSTSEVSVTYSYDKNIVGKYSGSGDGTRGPYFLRNIRNIVPGTETVQVWEQGSSIITTYTRNSSAEGYLRSTGYSINYDQDNPRITFNEELDINQNFQVIFQYVPPQAFAGGNLSQSVYGFDAGFKMGETFKVNASYAKSETDQVFIAETTVETISANGSKTYLLMNTKEIIEGSEKVFVNNNLLNRDIDYFISYSVPGQITFYYISPTALDNVTVEYQFQSLSGVAVGEKVKTGNAYNIGAQTKLFGDVLVVDGLTKYIDRDFTPMGGTYIQVGSIYNEYNVRFNPEDFHSLTALYSYKENDTPIGTEDRYLRSYDNSIDLGLSPLSLFNVDFNYRNYETMDDLSAIVTSHSNDTRQNSYGVSLSPNEWRTGDLSLNQKYDFKKTLAKTDTENDSSAFSETSTDYWHTNATLGFTDRFTFGFDYQQSEPKTVALTLEATTVEAVSSQTRSTDISYNVDLDLTPGILQRWTARVSLLDHRSETLFRNFTPTEEVITTKNETFHMDLVPINQINTALDHNRQERSTVVVGGANPTTQRTSGTVRFTPFSWISAGWNGSQSESIPETGAQFKTTGNSNAYQANWIPVSFDRFRLTSNFTASNNRQTGPSGTYEGIATDTDIFTQNYTFNFIPHPNAPIEIGYTIENYQNENNTPDPFDKINTETENTTIKAGVTITPMPALSLSTNYSEKTTKVIQDVDVTLVGQERKKTVLESQAIYQVFDWGTLVYDRQEENNNGEVQAGTVANIHIERLTQGLSLNINVPVDNPVLSSLTFIASMKVVDYKNKDNSQDDFTATLTTFEGALNF
jgi:hypothetical protein